MNRGGPATFTNAHRLTRAVGGRAGMLIPITRAVGGWELDILPESMFKVCVGCTFSKINLDLKRLKIREP